MSADATPPGLLSVLRLAIADPGSVLPRKGCCSGCGETGASWQVRACTPEMIEDWDQCPRCAALGQRDGKAVQR